MKETKQERIERQKYPVIVMIKQEIEPLIEQLDSRYDSFPESGIFLKYRDQPEIEPIKMSYRAWTDIRRDYPEFISTLEEYQEIDEEYHKLWQTVRDGLKIHIESNIDPDDIAETVSKLAKEYDKLEDRDPENLLRTESGLFAMSILEGPDNLEQKGFEEYRVELCRAISFGEIRSDDRFTTDFERLEELDDQRRKMHNDIIKKPPK